MTSADIVQEDIQILQEVCVKSDPSDTRNRYSNDRYGNIPTHGHRSYSSPYARYYVAHNSAVPNDKEICLEA